MKKRIKNLNAWERREICNKYCYNNCDGCPFKLTLMPFSDSYYCVHHIMNVLEREVEVKD